MKIMLIALLALLIHPNVPSVKAADTEPALRIIICDVRGEGIAQINVRVNAADDATLLAQSSTDSHGQALFPALPHEALRIVITGQLSDATVLRQRGSDAQGTWYNPVSGMNELGFVVRPDGVVDLNPDGLIEDEQRPAVGGRGAGEQGSRRTREQGNEGTGEQAKEGTGEQAKGGTGEQAKGGTGEQAKGGWRALLAIVLCVMITLLLVVLRRRPV